jgi:hypothetical protein
VLLLLLNLLLHWHSAARRRGSGGELTMWMSNTLLALLVFGLVFSASIVAMGLWSFHIQRYRHLRADYVLSAMFISGGGLVFGLCLWKLIVVVEALTNG